MTTTALPRTTVAPAAVARDADEVLGSARAARVRAVAAEVQVLVDAVDWAVLNPPLFGREAATWYAATSQGSAPEALEVTAEGVPDVDRAAVAELGIALGMSTQAAQRLLADALELAFRLPTVWTRVVAGEVRPWQARRVAQSTRQLSKLGAAFVDREIAPAADRVNGHQLEGLIATAMARHDAQLAEQLAAERAEQRDVQIHLDETTLAGLTPVNGWVDLPDALDLEAALSHCAEQLAAWGSQDPLNVRRARALGELAREHLTFTGQPATDHPADFEGGERGGSSAGEAGDGGGSTAGVRAGKRVRPKRQVVLYAHLTDAAIYDAIGRGTTPIIQYPDTTSTAGGTESSAHHDSCVGNDGDCSYRDGHGGHGGGDAGSGGGSGAGGAGGGSSGCGTSGDGWRVPVWVGRVENTATPVTAETIRAWCADPGTRVTVKPVLDLNGYQQADSYEVPGRIKEQIRLRDGTCIFPNCRAKALYCQDDHVEPYDHADPGAGGRTETSNLRLLCQRHHNLKTHHGFSYIILTNGAVLWRTPHGLRIRRNRDGTVDYLTRHRNRYGPHGDDGTGDRVEATTAARGGRRQRGMHGWDAIDGLETLNPADQSERRNGLDDLGPPPF
ncbi:HNH endonuclease signature motif containing protein [Pseudactinotalea terrae]|uniref:HNH endonuclease signature motif containing protein n=1 Tax=Pseudactinotalea terrae TaxID=1743262 RepID=UPI0012E1618C|nr:HNH endonuclease signature motif containing protein [Pseudactinotalea terrae]